MEQAQLESQDAVSEPRAASITPGISAGAPYVVCPIAATEGAS